MSGSPVARVAGARTRAHLRLVWSAPCGTLPKPPAGSRPRPLRLVSPTSADVAQRRSDFFGLALRALFVAAGALVLIAIVAR